MKIAIVKKVSGKITQFLDFDKGGYQHNWDCGKVTVIDFAETRNAKPIRVFKHIDLKGQEFETIKAMNEAIKKHNDGEI